MNDNTSKFSTFCTWSTIIGVTLLLAYFFVARPLLLPYRLEQALLQLKRDNPSANHIDLIFALYDPNEGTETIVNAYGISESPKDALDTCAEDFSYKEMLTQFRNPELHVEIHGDSTNLDALKQLSPYIYEVRILSFAESQSERSLPDLSVLKNMRLKCLKIAGTNTSDLSPLEGMPLVELYVDSPKVMDLSPLKGMPLECLTLYKTKVYDLSALKGMPLVELYVDSTKIQDLSSLSGMNTLVQLDISYCPIEDISALKGLPRLKKINVTKCRITDFSPLDGMNVEILGKDEQQRPNADGTYPSVE